MKDQHIFVSHAWKYSEAYYKVEQWLDEAQKNGTISWKNYSVPQHDPLIDPNSQSGKKVLQQSLKNQIAPASIVIVISGMYVSYSDWIDFEIDTSVSYGKYIIGLKPWGQDRLPAKVVLNSDEMVGWNQKSLIDAIKKFN